MNPASSERIPAVPANVTLVFVNPESVTEVPVIAPPVIASAPTSMDPNPDVMDPELRAPVPVMAVETASLVSTSATS